jgi:hypothetical protein
MVTITTPSGKAAGSVAVVFSSFVASGVVGASSFSDLADSDSIFWLISLLLKQLHLHLRHL